MRDGMRRLGLALLLGLLCGAPASSAQSPDRDRSGSRPWSDPPAKPAEAPPSRRQRTRGRDGDGKKPAPCRQTRSVAKPRRAAARPAERERLAVTRPAIPARIAARRRAGPGRRRPRRVAGAPPRIAATRPVRYAPPDLQAPPICGSNARADRIRRAGRRLPGDARHHDDRDATGGGSRCCVPSTTTTSWAQPSPHSHGRRARWAPRSSRPIRKARGRSAPRPGRAATARPPCRGRRRQGDEGGPPGGERQRCPPGRAGAASATVETVKERPSAWISPSRSRFRAGGRARDGITKTPVAPVTRRWRGRRGARARARPEAAPGATGRRAEVTA